MSSGRYLDLADLGPSDINLDDIERSLNFIYRFTGHHKDKKPLTVAQHSALVLELSTRLFPDEYDVHLHAFMHDWPEAYYGDVATPLKKLMKKWYTDYTEKVDRLVYNKYYFFKLTQEVEDKVKLCDLLALDIERRSMWRDQRGKDLWPDNPADFLPLKEKIELFDYFQNIEYVEFHPTYQQLKGMKDD